MMSYMNGIDGKGMEVTMISEEIVDENQIIDLDSEDALSVMYHLLYNSISLFKLKIEGSSYIEGVDISTKLLNRDSL